MSFDPMAAAVDGAVLWSARLHQQRPGMRGQLGDGSVLVALVASLLIS